MRSEAERFLGPIARSSLGGPAQLTVQTWLAFPHNPLA